MTSLTLVTVLIIAYGVLSRHGYGRALALGGVTASGAAAVVGSIAVPTFYTVALGTLVALGLSLLGNGKTPDASPPGPSTGRVAAAGLPDLVCVRHPGRPGALRWDDRPRPAQTDQVGRDCGHDLEHRPGQSTWPLGYLWFCSSPGPLDPDRSSSGCWPV